MKKYRKQLDNAMIELDPFRALWHDEMQEIFANYLPADQTDMVNNTFEILGIFGVERNISKTVFFLFDPAEGTTYFELNEKFHTLFFRGMVR